MRRRKVRSALFCSALFAVICAACTPRPPYDLVISGATVIDTVSGDTEIRTIGVRDGVISYVGNDDVRGVATISASGFWAVPGLWDMHAHISDESFFPLFLENGIVGVRDMGGDAEGPTDGCESVNLAVLKAWREEIEAGVRKGPRLVLAGPVASGSGSPTALPATTPENARETVRMIDQAGADFVKVYEDIQPAAFAALASEANAHAIPFAGHVSVETLTIEEAISAGQRSVEHVREHLILCFAESDEELGTFFVADDWDAEDRVWAQRHIDGCPQVWNGLRDRDVWLTPTLAVQETLLTAENAGFEDDPRRAALPVSIREAVKARSMSLRSRDDGQRTEAAIWNDYIFRLVRRARDERAKILAGSDAACEGVIPGYGLQRELQLLVDAGLSPLQALQSATIEAGRYLGEADRIGRIAEGYYADLILVRGDPLADVRSLANIETVIARGAVVTADDK